MSSGNSHDGILRFGAETVQVVILDLGNDGVEASLIAGELRRLNPTVPVIVLASESQAMAEGASKSADAIVLRSGEPANLPPALKALRKKR